MRLSNATERALHLEVPSNGFLQVRRDFGDDAPDVDGRTYGEAADPSDECIHANVARPSQHIRVHVFVALRFGGRHGLPLLDDGEVGNGFGRHVDAKRPVVAHQSSSSDSEYIMKQNNTNVNNRGDARRRAAAIDRILKRLFPHAAMALRCDTPWECLVAVQLSAQCTDKKVNEVTVALFNKYRTLNDYLRAKPREFERDIHSTGFYRNKTKNILAAAKVVDEVWRGELPRTIDDMVTIPGVGRKTANVVLGRVYGVVEGIAVDTHVRRLSRQLGFSRHSDPMRIERDLMTLFPKNDWYGLTYRLIEYGRNFAPARKRDHSDEPLAKYYSSSGDVK